MEPILRAGLAWFQSHTNADSTPVDGGCTLEQGLAFRKRLKLIGEDRFIKETVEAGVITAKKLITAFGKQTSLVHLNATFYPK